MERVVNANQKRPKKHPNTRKAKQPLKVVYFTNPIKFMASDVLEFRSIVQELTGQNAGFPESGGAAAAGGACPSSVEALNGVRHHDLDLKEKNSGVGQESGSGFGDGVYDSQKSRDFEGTEGSDASWFGSVGCDMCAPLHGLVDSSPSSFGREESGRKIVEGFEGLLGSKLWHGEGFRLDDMFTKSL